MEGPLLTLYFRHGCHLCDDMQQHLRGLQEGWRFKLEFVDIDRNQDLKSRYGTLVPVLAGDNEEICHYFLDEMALRNYLSNINPDVA